MADENLPPPYSPRKQGRLWIIAGLIALALGFIYYFADPGSCRFMPRCLFHTLTGWDCPGCGAQRMVHALAHGNLSGAWESNPFILCMLPLIGIGIWGDLRPGWARRFFYHPLTVRTLILAIILWGLLRNLL